MEEHALAILHHQVLRQTTTGGDWFMKLLEGKTALVFGVANDHSIAWGIAKSMHEHGARVAFSYASEALERRVRPLAESIDSTFVEKCDVTDDNQIEALFEKAKDELDSIDILVHAIAYAERDDLQGAFHQTSRAGFRLAMEISVYSYIALARAAKPLMGPGSSMLTLTYYGAQKAVLGRDRIRANAISAGPVRTLSAAGVSGFKRMYREFTSYAPLGEPISIEDIGGAAVWLASDMASKVTGEVLFVDSGYNIVGIPESLE
jgi:enoyl-[acyl-carrier protein] reductase I